MNPRTILFIHQAFPGQFGALAQSLAADGHKVFSLALNPQGKLSDVTLIRYTPLRKQLSEELPYLQRELDAKIVRGESAYNAMKVLKEKGLNPDVIYAHPGWGEALFVKNVWPDARFVVYAEWFYNVQGQEVNFDTAFPPLTEEEELRLTFKKTAFLHALSEADAAITPTEWQKSRFPAWAQDKIRVIHDGLNLEEIAKTKPRTLSLPSQGLKLRKGMPIVTYCARHLEPVRGFHYFMRSLPAILNGNPEAHVIIMGNDAGIKNIGYGKENAEASTWRKTMERELGDTVDWSRIHFLGTVDRTIYLAMMKLSACHVYLTTPFILSWSFLEAAALGLPIVASDTAPVREFSQLNGLQFVDFFDTDAIAQAVLKRLERMEPGFFDENIEFLRTLDQNQTLPAIKDVLLAESRAYDIGGPLESVVVLEDDEEEPPVPVQEKAKHAPKKSVKSRQSKTSSATKA